MAEGEFIGVGGIVRETILAGGTNHQGQTLLNGGIPSTTTQWNHPGIKTEPVVATVATSQNSFYPTTTYEWKVEDPQQLGMNCSLRLEGNFT